MIDHPSENTDEVARLLIERFDALLAGAEPTPVERELFEDLLQESQAPAFEPDRLSPRPAAGQALCHGTLVRRRRRPFSAR